MPKPKTKTKQRGTVKRGAVSATAPVKKKKVFSAEEQAHVEKKLAAKEAEKEAARLLKEAEKEGAKIKRDADKKRAKDKIEKDKKAKSDTALRKLDTEAKEINVRMDKAAKLNRDADDHRLAAALKLAIAKDTCRDAKISFSDWVEAHINLGYESVRKLLPIGAAENAEEGAGKTMLTDMRNANKAANKKSRDKQKADKATGPKAEPAERDRVKPAGERALEALGQMKPDERKLVVTDAAKEFGTLMSKNAAAAARRAEAGDGDDKSPRELAEGAFNALGAKAKVAFTNWCAERIGGKFEMGEAPEEEDPIDTVNRLKKEAAVNKKSREEKRKK